MRKYLLFAIIFLITFGFLGIEEAKAGTEHNVSGWAWSENIGWISFNSLNCDTDGDLTYEGPNEGNPPGSKPAPADCPTSGPVNSYGVSVDLSTGNFSGYAWSENIGWIWFAPTDTTPDGTVNPAKLDLGSGVCGGINKICGWARACAGAANADCTGGTNPASGGWDGWIHLKGTGYGVWLDTSISPNEFRNWAWGGNDSKQEAVVGWISFNHLNCDTDGDGFSNGGGNCPPSGTPIANYKVFIRNEPPSATNLNLSENYCGVSQGKGQILFKWTYSDPDGNPQSQYQFQIATDIGFNNIVYDRTVSPQPLVESGSTENLTVVVPDDIGFNNTYYWRVKVKDCTDSSCTVGQWSDWATTGSPFSTPLHAYPWVNFNFSPAGPSVNESIQFCSVSEGKCSENLTFCYGTSCSWDWDFNSDGITDSNLKNPTHSYGAQGSYNVQLKVTDNDGYSCSHSDTIKILPSLPRWREILPPTSFLEKFLASFFQILKLFV